MVAIKWKSPSLLPGPENVESGESGLATRESPLGDRDELLIADDGAVRVTNRAIRNQQIVNGPPGHLCCLHR